VAITSLHKALIYIFELVQESASFKIFQNADKFFFRNVEAFKCDDILIFEGFQNFTLIDEGVLTILKLTYSLLSEVLSDMIFAANFLLSDLRSTRYTLAVAPFPSYFTILNLSSKPSSQSFLRRISWMV
jgi:hypothetical protein